MEDGFYIRSIKKVECSCVICGWVGIIDDCEPDINEDHDFGCPKCHSVITKTSLKLRKCRNCFKPFLPRHSEGICSSVCQKENFYKIRQTAYTPRCCELCKKEFIPIRDAQKYCSKGCGSLGGKIESEKNKKIKYFDIFKRDKFRCVYCGKTPKDDGVKLVIDHVFPIINGGEGEFFNLVTACYECNSNKGGLPFSIQLTFEFWDYADGDFSYEKAKEVWKKDEINRKKIPKK